MPFKKGDPNINRNGRPAVKTALNELLREHGEKPISTKSKKTHNQALVEKLYNLAKQGDVNAIKYIFDRLLGKPNQTIDNSHTFEKPEVIKIITSLYEEEHDPKEGGASDSSAGA